MTDCRVVIFSTMQPCQIYRLVERLELEVSGIKIAGLLYEVSSPSRRSGIPSKADFTFSDRLGDDGLLGRFRRLALRAAHSLLRFAQASSVETSRQTPVSVGDLVERCTKRGWQCYVTADFHDEQSLKFVRELIPDVGLLLEARTLEPVLYTIPRLGTVALRERLLDNRTELLLSTHLVEEGSKTTTFLRQRGIRVDPYDNQTSLSLKAGIIGEDLLVETMQDFTLGTAHSQTCSDTAKTSHAQAHESSGSQRPSASQQAYKARRRRPAWKLLLRSSAYLWLLPFRNWKRRAKKVFPLVVLFHHLISDRPHPMALSTEGFLRHLRYLKQHYRLVSLAEGMRLLASGRIEEPTAVLTFDDGYEDNFVNMRAVLRVEPAPVTMFVCPELIEKRQPFPHDVRDGRGGFEPLWPAQVQRLANEGMEIGSHTRTHFDCRSTDGARLRNEIADSRQDLETLLGRPVTTFSFPWGKPVNMSEPAIHLAKANYEHYFSAYGGANFPGALPQHLVRTDYALDLWELELALQQLLDFRPTGYRQGPRANAKGELHE